ncbi:Gfo/Idh/MocA family protein [Butyricicoccus porcorum]|uniref:Oxidoreductase n=1 Tax=Butyricicoccus porcorum TaxID=1945634 RepID=A0A252F1F1_9FIRM|nr:Gfo/Idh/MocA family oxidoreductase [Butyricicoccus porcorum]MCI6926708.1 Gfo/Idh/MocA family oxidoreductase [Butyricicoccus porcorum]MDD6987856.1 Gfo/Idh/MocA family oxidoreductase [Butyricicoccus porcorum]MDY4483901.1 Gfo/Idh/MocA family oxidoreductase [Butyricicoccus porcorum]OUM19644.1 oxidoreductase [Butyricicoccus porcorum]
MINGSKVLDHPIRWAMVGGGKGSQIGYIHRSAALRDNNFQLVAGAFDINPERGMAFAAELGVAPDRCYPDYKTMFEEEAKREDGIEAVSIATPNGMHYTVCKAALEAGLHVVCEKPLCFTSEEAEELVALAKEKNRVVGVTYGYSGHQMIQQARQMIQHGDLGDIRVINMSFAFGGYNYKIEETNPAAKWRFDPTKAGPSFALGDVGTHPLFIIEAMIPDMKIDNLMCTKDSFVEGRELEDNAFVIMRLKGSKSVQEGAKVYCWASSINCGARHGHKIRVVGSKASIEWDDERPNQMTYEIEGEPVRTLERGAGYLYPEARVEDRIGGGHAEGLFEAWANLYRRFAVAMDAANNGEEYGDFWYPNVESGAQGVKWIEKCVESANNGACWVDYE